MLAENKPNSFKTNYIFNLLSEIVTLLVPLITTPYVSRVLYDVGVGQYSFSNSIVSYFVLLATFGFGQYSRREIAKCRNNKNTYSLVFWEIILCRSLTSIFSIGLFAILIVSKCLEKYNIIMLALSFYLLDTLFNVNFFFQGVEEFKSISIRNVLVKIIGMICIFIFVNNESDIWIYALCLSLSAFVGNIVLWPSLLKRLSKTRLQDIHFLKHFIPSLRLFLPTIALSLYTLIDKSLIGFLSLNPDYENGCYEQAYKIISILTTIITIISPIMLSKNTYLISSGKTAEVNENLSFSITYVLIIGIPLTVGTLVLANNFSSWFFGEGFEDVPKIMCMLSPIILLMGISNTLGLQLLLPMKKDTLYSISILTGLFSNVILNLILIPKYGAFGAAIGTSLSELIIVVLDVIFAVNLKVINVNKTILPLGKYLMVGLAMAIIMYVLQKKVFNFSILSFLIVGCTGVLVYFGVLLLIKDTFIVNVLKNIKKKEKNKDE